MPARGTVLSPASRAIRCRVCASQIEDRLHRVDRGAPVGRLAEHVVEDLERKRSGVPRDQHLLQEARQVELALPRKAAVVPAPLQHVHREARRVRHLQEEDLLAGNGRDAFRIVAQRQDVEAVDDDAEVRMIGGLDDRPRVLVMTDVPRPRERLVAHAQIAPRGAIRELVELRRNPRVVGDGAGRCIRADEDHRRTQRLHDVELALRAVEIAPELRVGRRIEVAKRLVEIDAEAAVVGHSLQIPRACRES